MEIDTQAKGSSPVAQQYSEAIPEETLGEVMRRSERLNKKNVAGESSCNTRQPDEQNMIVRKEEEKAQLRNRKINFPITQGAPRLVKKRESIFLLNLQINVVLTSILDEKLQQLTEKINQKILERGEGRNVASSNQEALENHTKQFKWIKEKTIEKHQIQPDTILSLKKQQEDNEHRHKEIDKKEEEIQSQKPKVIGC